MAVITAITPQKRDKTRCNIEIDGRYFCAMDLATALSNRLKAGMEISPEELSRIQFESEKQTAFDKALHALSYAGKTEQEVRDRLLRKGYLPEICDDVIEKMKRYGFLDDESYAKAYAEEASKRKGARLIGAELRRKGVAEETIAAALEGVESEEGAKNVLAKYLRGKDVTDRAVLRKAFSYLLSKGFDYDAARAALSGLYDED